MKRRSLLFHAPLLSLCALPLLKADDGDGDNIHRLERAVVEAALAWSGPFAIGTDQQRSDATVTLLDAVNALKSAKASKGGKNDE